MTIVHGQGVDVVQVRFCLCMNTSGERKGQPKQPPEPIQLIHYGLWPATWKIPQTAFTIGGLRAHHLLSLQSNIFI